MLHRSIHPLQVVFEAVMSCGLGASATASSKKHGDIPLPRTPGKSKVFRAWCACWVFSGNLVYGVLLFFQPCAREIVSAFCRRTRHYPRLVVFLIIVLSWLHVITGSSDSKNRRGEFHHVHASPERHPSQDHLRFRAMHQAQRRHGLRHFRLQVRPMTNTWLVYVAFCFSITLD